MAETASTPPKIQEISSSDKRVRDAQKKKDQEAKEKAAADAAAKKKIEEVTKSTHTKIQEVSTSSSDYNDYSKFETTPRNLSYDEAKAQTDKAKVNSDVEDIQK